MSSGNGGKRPDFLERQSQAARAREKNKRKQELFEGMAFPYTWSPLTVSVTPRIHTYLQSEEGRRLLHAIERPAKKLGEKITEIMKAEAEEKGNG